MTNNFVATLQALLEKELATTQLHIEDDSASHAGHGATGGHYNIQIASPQFSKKTTLQCHRLIHNVVQQSFQNGVIHALSIRILR